MKLASRLDDKVVGGRCTRAAGGKPVTVQCIRLSSRKPLTVQCCSTGKSSRQISSPRPVQHALATLGAAACVLMGASEPAQAMSQKVAEFQASGFIFKDSVEVTAIDDPEITGITLYISDFKRSIVDKLSKDFFSEPSQASLGCAVTGPVAFRQGDPAKLGGTEGAELFSEAKGLNLFKNKTLRIRRVYDADRNSVVYVAYSTRLSSATDDKTVSSGRYRTSICAVNLPPPVAAPAVTAAALSEALNN